MASNRFEQREIDPRQKNYYELKKVGKHWIIKAGGKVKHLQFANNAREVYLDENIIAVDDILFEIKEDSSGDIFTERISSLVCQSGLDDKKQTIIINQAEKYEIEQDIYDIGSRDLDKGNDEHDSLEAGQTEVDSIIETGNINAAEGEKRESVRGTKSSLNSVSASGTRSHSGQTSVRTSEFYRNDFLAYSAQSKIECKFLIPEGYTAEFIQICCEDTIDSLEKSNCDVSITKDAVVVKAPPDELKRSKTRMAYALLDMRKEYPSWEILDLTQSNFNQSDVMRKLEEIKNSLNVKCVINKMKTTVEFFGKNLQDVKDAKSRVVSLLLLPRDKTDPNNSKVLEEAGGAGSRLKPGGISRQFSWSTRTTALAVFETKEKIIVKVYSADILSVPVDCIVNAANVDLNHGGGIARAIEKAAGKDLTKEGHDFLKKNGKLRVGEACSTGAGKMNYKCVIHAVGPCWSYYKPYSLRDLERCETDLYNAVINSLGEAEKRKMETIAISSISSGIYGCPPDLCSVQYAKAVVDYTRLSRSPVKEIHFVDINMEMVKLIQTTFQSMIPKEKIPSSYNKLRHVKSQDTTNGRDTGNNFYAPI